MKKLLMLALFAAPLFSFAQEKTTTTKKEELSATATTKPDGADNKLTVANPEQIFVELIVMDYKMTNTLRVEFGRDVAQNIQDKEVMEQLMALRKAPFSSVADAMTYFASIGYKYVMDYETSGEPGHETHIVFEKKLNRKNQGQGQEGARPNTGVKPELNNAGKPAPTQGPAPAPKTEGKSRKK
jgi:hypothetical protein